MSFTFNNWIRPRYALPGGVIQGLIRDDSENPNLNESVLWEWFQQYNTNEDARLNVIELRSFIEDTYGVKLEQKLVQYLIRRFAKSRLRITFAKFSLLWDYIVNLWNEFSDLSLRHHRCYLIGFETLAFILHTHKLCVWIGFAKSLFDECIEREHCQLLKFDNFLHIFLTLKYYRACERELRLQNLC